MARKNSLSSDKKLHFEGPVFCSDMPFLLFMKNVLFQSTSLCPLGNWMHFAWSDWVWKCKGGALLAKPAMQSLFLIHAGDWHTESCTQFHPRKSPAWWRITGQGVGFISYYHSICCLYHLIFHLLIKEGTSLNPDGLLLIRQLIRKVSVASISINKDQKAYGVNSIGTSCLSQRGLRSCRGWFSGDNILAAEGEEWGA